MVNGNNFRLTTLHNNPGKQVTSPARRKESVYKAYLNVSQTCVGLHLPLISVVKPAFLGVSRAKS